MCAACFQVLILAQLSFAQVETIPPVRYVSADSFGQVVADIESRMEPDYAQTYAEPSDLINWAHEGTHGLNSLLRNRLAPQGNAYYYLQGRAAILPSEPRTSLERVAENIPTEARGDRYELYLVTQRADWNDKPSYLLDEASAYCNGAWCLLELGQRAASDRSLPHDIEAVAEFQGYVAALWQTVQKDDPHFAHMRELAGICALHHACCRQILDRARTKGLVTDRTRQFVEHFNGRYRPPAADLIWPGSH